MLKGGLFGERREVKAELQKKQVMGTLVNLNNIIFKLKKCIDLTVNTEHS